MPDNTRSGRASRMIALTASSTQSVGVPSTAKRRAPSLRMRSGRLSVSEWLAPLCSCSGATTHTLLLRLRATLASSLSPGALMPSSLVTRMRAAARSMGRSNTADRLHPAHIGLQRIGHGDRAVVLLVVLQHGDEGAADGKPGPVERMDKARALAFFRAEACANPPGLKLAAIRAARDLAIGVLPRQPDLDVVGLARGESHIARAEQHHAIGEPETLQHLFRTNRHPLVLLHRAVRMRNRYQLDLGELMLADHAARVLAGGTSLGAEARGPGGDPQRQIGLLDDLVGDEIGERHFRRRNEPEALRRLEHVFSRFRQLPGTEDRLVAHQQRRAYLAVAEFARVQVEHELRERSLEPRQSAVEHDEARAGELPGAIEVHEPQRLAEGDMVLGFEGEARRRSMLPDEAVAGFVEPVRHIL